MTTKSDDTSPLVLWKERPMKGYVTQLCEVTEREPLALAARLGFAPHLLKGGYALMSLISPVARQDFTWRDTTRFSAGWVVERVYFKAKNRLAWSDEYVQRADQDRFLFHQGDGYRGEKSWDAFLDEQERRLNVRQGSERIIKVIPLVRGADGDYPNAKKDNALQWELRVEKQFVCIAMVAPGAMVHNGDLDVTRPGPTSPSKLGKRVSRRQA